MSAGIARLRVMRWTRVSVSQRLNVRILSVALQRIRYDLFDQNEHVKNTATGFHGIKRHLAPRLALLLLTYNGAINEHYSSIFAYWSPMRKGFRKPVTCNKGLERKQCGKLPK